MNRRLARTRRRYGGTGRAGVAAPILVDGHLWGRGPGGLHAGAVHRRLRARLGAFAELIAPASANIDARIKLKESRARIVEAAEEARRRIERDLYNGAQQRLVAISLSLPLAATQAELPTATALRGVRLPQRLALGASGSGELGFSPQGGARVRAAMNRSSSSRSIVPADAPGLVEHSGSSWLGLHCVVV
jgi:hypothetical protein